MPSFLSQVLGTWDLLSYTAVNVVNTEDIFYPMGKECKGQIMYTEDGYMAAILQWNAVEPYEPDWTQGTTRELANAAKKTLAYCGPFYLDERPGNKQTLLHHAKISLPPNWINTIQLREAELTAAENGQLFLTLGPRECLVHKGVQRIVRLKWRKLPHNQTSNLPEEAKA
ncbi:hypothetical protein LTR99_004927 [Exophiala xenobiotica]|uniref:Lipocalin-like domain-containing protein n=1 Tax=Vermiconidia calcicola TaxID=1690605 RepID=A0AAV9QF85_9PEZI|nr:hypothetical protein LTR92_000672 [Exophiala xenobiotica]KAK5536380.1 hypothetical protein LTR23_007958 [Chaetothyriales sp. CCFEE 6169]KAK5540207.1 hypothetical protein LTR25_003912 [Vermiconidia calcicola]KAK5259353.1 hypothetical protein LTR40_006133 [Exophiala xenobiotica]KAK5265889.1 hypothetical protein LTR96_008790 [Exophiala xenobiotica]